MNAKELYTKQMNAFCEDNCKITAADILAKAGNRTNGPDDTNIPDDTAGAGDSKIVPITGKKKTFRFGNMAAACLICFLLAGTTILATEYLGKFIKNIMGDEKTMEIVEKGYTYEVQESLSDDRFSTTLLGFTGDRNEPKVLIDLFINDPTISVNEKTVGIKVYTLGVEQFENELDHYGYWEAYGVKDEEIKNLYHFSFTGAAVWLTRGEEAVIQICEVFVKDAWGIQSYEADFEYRVTIPKDSFHPVPYVPYSGESFTYDDVEYTLNAAQYGYYYTQVSFYSDTIVENPPTADRTVSTISTEMDRNWNQLAKTAKLVVDGIEYQLLEDEGYSMVWFDTNGETGTPYRCYMHLFFPDIDYGNAKDIILKIGGSDIVLK